MATKKKPPAHTMYITQFVVEGSGRFPLDMLRYDGCLPASERDSNAIGKADTKRRVRLTRQSVNADSAPTAARWQSFGWQVLSGDAFLEVAS